MVRVWETYCDTEGQYYSSEKNTLFTCPVDAGHTIDRTKIRSRVRYDKNEVTVQQENHAIGGYIGIEGITVNAGFSILGPLTTTQTATWPHDINIISSKVYISQNSEGDILNIYVNKDTIVGVVTAAVSPSDSTFTVSDTVVLNTDVGFLVKIDDGVNIDNVGYVTAIDLGAGTITVSGSATNSFAIGAFIKISIHMVRDVNLIPNDTVGAGETNLGSTHVPAGAATFYIDYTNNSTTTAKTLRIINQFYY